MRFLLAPIALLYGAGVWLRNRHYDQGHGVERLPVPVISVGNLTVGGSGKTPFVAALVRLLLQRGERVAILSRGYGRRSRSPFVLVSDGERLLATCEEAGDEPFELASSLPSVPVGVGPNRAHVGRALIEAVGPRVLVLDDGFQHRRLHRDVDLVCFDASESPSRWNLLPVGRLREPASSMARADAVVLTGAPPASVLHELPILRTITRVVGFTRVGVEGEGLDANAFESEPVGLFCAVARPERVRDSVPGRVVFFHARRDHHWWRLSELETLSKSAKARGAKALLTTAKDAAKLSRLSGLALALPLYAMRIELDIENSEELEGLLDRVRLPPT